MNEPPSPSGDKQCFNCGKDLRNSAAFCPHCGAAFPTQGSGVKIALRFIGATVLNCFSIAVILNTGCAFFAFIGVLSLGISSILTGESFGLWLFGLLLLTIAVLCIWGAISIIKKR